MRAALLPALTLESTPSPQRALTLLSSLSLFVRCSGAQILLHFVLSQVSSPRKPLPALLTRNADDRGALVTVAHCPRRGALSARAGRPERYAYPQEVFLCFGKRAAELLILTL